MKTKILTPVVSIFNEDGSFDLIGNALMLDHLVAGGVDGIVPLGSTGEYTTLSMEQKRDYLDYYIETAAGRLEILPGTGSETVSEAINLSNHVFKNHGNKVKGVLVISEYYYNMNADDFYRYYAHLAQNIDGRLYIYNYPERTGNDIPIETVVKLSKDFKNIVGIKDSVINFSHTAEIIKQVREVAPDFEVFSGYDNQFLENVSLGGAGGIGALSNLFPGLWSRWVAAANNKCQEEMERIGNQIKTLMQLYSLSSNPQKTLKELLKNRGLSINTTCRFPFNYLPSNALEKGQEIIKNAGV